MNACACPFTSDSYSILKQYESGSCSEEECFCMILSIEGFEKTLHFFSSFISPLLNLQPQLHKQLLSVFKEYFSHTNTQSNEAIGCSVENGFLTSDIDFELDIELAKTLSLAESQPQPCGKGKSDAKNVTPPSTTSCKTTSQQPKNKFDVKEDAPFQHSVIPGLHINDQPSKKKRRKKGHTTVHRPLINKPVLYWFRRDLRLHDNPALCAAAAANAPVVFVYIWSSIEEDPLNFVAAGGATKLWLHYALKELDKSIKDKFGNRVLFFNAKHQSSQEILKSICKQTGANQLIVNDLYEPFLNERDDEIFKTLTKSGIHCNRFHSYLLHEPSSINTETLGMRGVGSVTHFMECCRQSAVDPIGQPVESPVSLPLHSDLPDCDALEDLELAKMPRRRDGSVVK